MRRGWRRSARAARSIASGRPLTTTRTTGVPVATTASSSSCWRPENPRSRRSRNSPVVESLVSPERSPSTTIATSASPAASAAAAMPSSVPSEMPQPGCVADIGVRQRRADGVEDRAAPVQLVGGRDRGVVADAERVALGPHLVERLDVDEVAVVAEQVAGAVGDRSDDGDPTDRRGEVEGCRRWRRARASGGRGRGRPAPRLRRGRRGRRARAPRRTAARTARDGTSGAASARPTRSTVASSMRPSSSASASGGPYAAVRGSSESTPATSARRAASPRSLVRRWAVASISMAM